MSDTKAIPVNKRNIVTQQKMNYYNKKYYMSDHFLGNSLLTIANKLNSPRENMFNSHLSQFLVLLNPETPKVFTGYEKEIGKYSKSYYKTDKPMVVVDKISKFQHVPDLQYVLIVKDSSGFYDVIHRKPSQQLTETYGYVNVNINIDSKKPESGIMPGELLYHSTSFDELMNYRYGINGNTIYMSIPEVTEDSIVISESFANKLQYCSIETVEVSINTNDILLNIYGDDEKYKVFPEVGESIVNNILAARRRIQFSSIIHDLKNDNLKHILFDDDDVFYCTGNIIDLDIYCNKKLEEIEKTDSNSQILYYITQQREYYKKIKTKLEKIIKHNPGNVSENIIHLYHRAEDLLGNKQVINNNTKFENIFAVFTILKIKTAKKGHKLTGRYGNKGVIGAVWKDEDMPINEYGEKTDIILSPQGVFSRLNIGQWYEQELNFLADNVIRDIKNINNPQEQISKIIEFISDINVDEGMSLSKYIASLNPMQLAMFVQDIFTNGLFIHQPPFWKNVNFDHMKKLYKKYKYPNYKMSIKGKPIRKSLIMGKTYILLLKQTPESKYSARSLGMISSLGHPSKSIKFKKKNIPISNTPIRVGEMEVMNLNMANDSELVAKFLAMYANSKVNRENLVKTILISDPYNVADIPYIPDNINRKILNSYLKSIGWELTE